MNAGFPCLLSFLAAQEVAPSNGALRDGWRGYYRRSSAAEGRKRNLLQAAFGDGGRGQGALNTFDLDRWIDEYEDNHEEGSE